MHSRRALHSLCSARLPRCPSPVSSRRRAGVPRRPRRRNRAAADPLSEAIRERIDHLRYAAARRTDHVVRGARIVLDRDRGAILRMPAVPAAVAAIRSGSTSWSPHRRPADDGLDPADYHIEALQSFRSDCGRLAADAAGSAPISSCSPPTHSCSRCTTCTWARWTR